jgi:hypothetical protein
MTKIKPAWTPVKTGCKKNVTQKLKIYNVSKN